MAKGKWNGGRVQDLRGVPSMKGWYHTGNDSFDNPQISLFGDEGPDYANRQFENHGPFDTFEDAKTDLIEMVNCDIDNLRMLKANARRFNKTEAYRLINERNVAKVTLDLMVKKRASK